MDIKELIAKLDDPAERNDARDALVDLGDAATKPLLEAIKVRFQKFLEGLTRSDHLPAREKILQDRDFQFSFFVSYILKRVGAPEHVILDAIEAADARVRYAGAIALGMLRDVRAIFPLTEALEDENPKVTVEVAEALRKIGNPAVEGLVEVLLNKNVAARRHAAAQLGYIGKSTGDPKSRGKLLSALVEALKDDDKAVVETANAALFEITGQDFEESQSAAACWIDQDS